jgi:hypothetical protein
MAFRVGFFIAFVLVLVVAVYALIGNLSGSVEAAAIEPTAIVEPTMAPEPTVAPEATEEAREVLPEWQAVIGAVDLDHNRLQFVLNNTQSGEFMVVEAERLLGYYLTADMFGDKVVFTYRVSQGVREGRTEVDYIYNVTEFTSFDPEPQDSQLCGCDVPTVGFIESSQTVLMYPNIDPARYQGVEEGNQVEVSFLNPNLRGGATVTITDGLVVFVNDDGEELGSVTISDEVEIILSNTLQEIRLPE